MKEENDAEKNDIEKRERGKPRDWDKPASNHATNGSTNAAAAAGCRERMN